MTCAAFLQYCSDYRDDEVRDATLRRALEEHLRSCRRCQRVLAVMDGGLAELREADALAPSPGFRAELDRRLGAEIAHEYTIMPARAGLAATFLVAAAIGLLLYEAFSHADPAGEPPAVAVSPFPAPPPVAPALIDVTLPAFARSNFTFTSSQSPLGVFAGTR
jgi:hypothetical protein